MSASPPTPESRQELVRALPTFVQRAISSIRVHDSRVPVPVLRRKYRSTEELVLGYVEQTRAWIADVDAELVRRGANQVKRDDPKECAEFLERIDLRSLERKRLREALVDVALLELNGLRRAIEQRARDEH